MNEIPFYQDPEWYLKFVVFGLLISIIGSIIGYFILNKIIIKYSKRYKEKRYKIYQKEQSYIDYMAGDNELFQITAIYFVTTILWFFINVAILFSLPIFIQSLFSYFEISTELINHITMVIVLLYLANLILIYFTKINIRFHLLKCIYEKIIFYKQQETDTDLKYPFRE